MRLGLILAMLLALVPGIARACDCATLPPDQLVRSTTLLFLGETMIPRQVVPEGGAAFQHSQVFKGPNLTTPVIANNRPGGDPSCAADFYLSTTYLVPAFGTFDSGYYTDKCAMDNANADKALGDKIAAYLAVYYFQVEKFLQSIGYIDMQSLKAVRQVADFYLEKHSPDQAMRYYKQAIDVSRGSVLDLLGSGESYLQMGMGREALQKFDDVLEKDNTQQAAWSGRYKALAIMGRWSEIPQDKFNMPGFEWHAGKLTIDLNKPMFSKAWWVQVDTAGHKLTGADFSSSTLGYVSFKGSDLTGANFSRARLYNIDFTDANLKDVQFNGVRYENVKWPHDFVPPESAPEPSLVGQQNPASR